jgi:hypothetical protein
MARMSENRCIDLSLGQKVLSYDLLVGEEKQAVDAHLEVCAACRDFMQQAYGREGALQELNWRAWRLGRRHNVEASWWLAQRLRNLWLPFLLLFGVVSAVALFAVSRGPERFRVHILYYAVTRGATLDATATPKVDPGPNGVHLRTDRPAHVYVYLVQSGTMQRIVPSAGGVPPSVGPDQVREVSLPDITDRTARVILVIVAEEAPGTLDEWDAAVFAELGHATGETEVSKRGWPGNVRPTLRWYP